MSKKVLLLITIFLLSGCMPKIKEEVKSEMTEVISYDILHCNDKDKDLEIAICEILKENAVVVYIDETDEREIKNKKEKLETIPGVASLNFVDKRELMKNLKNYSEEYNSSNIDSSSLKNVFVIYPKENDQIVFIVKDIKKLIQLNDLFYYIIN